MKTRLLRRGGYSVGQFDASGGEAFGSVVLQQTPQSNLHAVNVNYLSIKKDQLPAGSFGSGLLPVLSLPVFSGDITSIEGTSILSLNSIGVTDNSTYMKVTVNEKGQVLGGNVLLENDLPDLPYSKVTTGKPTTTGGYGITEALDLTGGVFTGVLKVSTSPSTTEELANLTYLNSITAQGQGSDAPTGVIIYRNSDVTPNGFLRCNGSVLDKTVYANLYSVIGDQYTFTLAAGSGKPWEQQYLINTSQKTVLGSWTTETNFPTATCYSSVAVTKNRVYVLGGYVTDVVNTIYTAPINSNGTLGTWTTAGTLPVVTSYAAVVVVRNKLYLFGGWDGTNILATVRVAPINSDGTLGTWTTSTALPAGRYNTLAIITNTKLYILGGMDSNYVQTATTWYANINSDGTLGAWTVGTVLPVTTSRRDVAVIKDKVYVFYTGKYAVATINSDGTIGTWSTAIDLPIYYSSSKTYVTNGRLYIMGGYNSTTLQTLTNVHSAPINADGTLGAFTTDTSLNTPMYDHSLIATSSKLYILNGGDNNGSNNKILSSSITGGLNDYSTYYNDIVLSSVNVNYFTLPNINPSMMNTYAYIKI